MSEQRIDHAADAATSEPGDEVQGVGDAVGAVGSEAGSDVAPGERRGPGDSSSVPGAGREELDEQEDVPATEGARELVETVRSISRLEESN